MNKQVSRAIWGLMIKLYNEKKQSKHISEFIGGSKFNINNVIKETEYTSQCGYEEILMSSLFLSIFLGTEGKIFFTQMERPSIIERETLMIGILKYRHLWKLLRK
ncbi:hypothetical protein RF11_06076 [Thelohanellus kitauei]|uniref:Uncharacterized protein n=1 Tax=Thelohanellus kitauei TaxID=669202 RepID=A0A0C2MSD0_THEKT|nr:hypothetical protein RF11_06076 [Thelohanellus kitauei]